MACCLNPDCPQPEIPDGANFCQSCGTGLVPLLRHRYRVVSLLSSGGFGRTFLAEDTDTPSQRRCVIKQLRPISHNPQIYQLVQERFRREAAVLEQLGEDNPRVPQLYAYFTEGGLFYLVQQWIDGETLTEKVHSQGKLNEATVKNILVNVLEVLDDVHSQGIIHRDIKPANIILRRRDSNPVLIDFGAVKETMGTVVDSQGTPTSSIVIGTPGFMPNEQAAGKPVRSSDLYSLGLTAIYALIGKIPQELSLDQDTGEILWHDFAQNVSPELRAVLDKVICSYPRERYSSAKDMLAAIHSISQPIQSTPTEPTPPTVPQSIISAPSTPLVIHPGPPSFYLETAIGMDYTRLQDYLASGQWREANEETLTVMLKVASREKEGWLNKDSINNFPCNDLRTINQLWLHYSNGRFGFSVQKQIWLECGGKIDRGSEQRLGDRIGWRVNKKWVSRSSIRYSIDAPTGHLPFVVRLRGTGQFMRTFLSPEGGNGSSLASRAASCSL